MKKIIIATLMVIMGMFIFAGCGDDANSNSSTNGETEGEICASLIPDPNKYFTNAEITTMLDGRCYYYIVKYQDGEYDNYINAIKDSGKFPIIHYENSNDTGKTFMAYDKNKEYYLEIYFSYDNQGITIECHKTEESTSNEQQ